MLIRIDLPEDSALKPKEAIYVFKTLCLTWGLPWHIVGADYSEAVDINYGNPSLCESRVQITPLLASEKNQKPTVFFQEDLCFLDFGQGEKMLESSGEGYLFHNDFVYALFYLLNGLDEKNIDRNRWDQHNVKQSLLYKNDLLHRPVFNEYARFLKRIFENRYSFLPKWGGKKSALALSHDTDYPEMIKSIEMLRYVLKYKQRAKPGKLMEIMNGKEHFWKFDDFVELEKSHGAKSAFYFSSFKGNLPRFFLKAPDCFYDIRKKKFKEVAKQLDREGFEVGLHSSFRAFMKEADFQGEKDKLEREFDLPILGHRHHYWHTNPENPSETCAIHQRAGLEYDSSLSFEKHSGFRNSICTPFHVWERDGGQELDILQLPPTLMDDHLFGYSPLNKFKNYREQIDDLIEKVAEHEGVFVADFHVRVLNETFFPKWGEAYRYMLERISERGDFYMDTPLNIARHWKKREESILKQSKDEVCSTVE